MKKPKGSIWFDGKFVDYDKANVHVLTHSLQYGSGIFEGIRSFRANGGSALFRLDDHVKRFFNSAKICGMKLRVSRAGLSKAIMDTVRKNGLDDCYVRPFSFYNDSNIGLDVTGKKVSTIVAAVGMGPYFRGKSSGLRCKVSSWERISPSVLPTEAKASGNYVNSLLASMEAKRSGFDEAILPSEGGFVTEGAAENIFIVEDGNLVTPSKEANILMGITRDTVIKIAKTIGIGVEEREVHREELYTCDEAFFTGTAAGVVPIINIDSKKVGSGRAGGITESLMDEYDKTVHGNSANPIFRDWLTYL